MVGATRYVIIELKPFIVVLYECGKVVETNTRKFITHADKRFHDEYAAAVPELYIFLLHQAI